MVSPWTARAALSVRARPLSSAARVQPPYNAMESGRIRKSCRGYKASESLRRPRGGRLFHVSLIPLARRRRDASARDASCRDDRFTLLSVSHVHNARIGGYCAEVLRDE
jgi:hypothetical protein